jgi:putative cell wall-binding protein
VAVSGLASFEQRPILLVIRDAVPSETAQAMTDLGVTDAVVVGGTAAVSASTAAALEDPDGDGTSQVTVERESGQSRFATSVAIAQRSVAAGASTLDLWFATGLAFPDALAAGPAVARSGGVLVLVHGTDVNGGPEVYTWLQSLDRDRTLNAWLVGGPAAVTDAVANKLATAAGIS